MRRISSFLNTLVRAEKFRTVFLYFIFGIITLGLSAQAYLKPTELTGKVICNGRAVKNVVVTDGYTCVKTTDDGSYYLIKNPSAEFVYISMPAGYTADVKSTIPGFYKSIRDGITRYDFDIRKNPKGDMKHIVFVQSDVQVT